MLTDKSKVAGTGKDASMVHFNMRLPRWMLDSLRKIAEADCRPTCGLVRKLMQDEINRKGG